MNPRLTIEPEWEPADHGPAELRETSALLRISAGKNVLTRNENAWSRSVHDAIRVSAYPLALWFVSGWWRLRWEPVPIGLRGLSWRMAHETAAAGYGFLWPTLEFGSDGERVRIASHQSDPLTNETVRYLSSARVSVSAGQFERSVENFVNLVIARLDAVGLAATQLHALWSELAEERAEPAATRYRSLEARLGFEPDETPAGLVEKLEDLIGRAGEQAVAELATACAGAEPERALDKIVHLAESPGVTGRIASPASLPHRSADDCALAVGPPWERGRQLARMVRTTYALPQAIVSDRILAEVLGVEESVFNATNGTAERLPAGLAVRGSSTDRVSLLFRKHNRAGRRFEAARLLAAHLSAPATEQWLPATDAKTARQKMQRAFATELLCPIDELRDFLAGDLSEEAIDNASEHFAVSPLAVRSHLRNNSVL